MVIRLLSLSVHMELSSLFTLLICLACLRATHAQDGAVLLSLRTDQWKNTPPSWGTTDDPCGSTPWEGVKCNGSRVTELKLTSMGIEGTLSGDIGQLSELTLLDLSYNPSLAGPLPHRIGDLKKLTSLILVGCNFTGEIPVELGTIAKLEYLALNSNKFSGVIPPALGNLSKLYWLDITDNMLTGPLPISEGNTPGLDQLLKAGHFHFSKNKLSGTIPESLFSTQMSLIHVLFDGNEFTGEIPSSIGLVEGLEVLRLDRNQLNGSVPSNLNNLTHITELNLANNLLTGPMPNLTGMSVLNYVDLSNNKFDQSETPAWFSELKTLTALVIESGNLHGEIPQALFSFPQLQQVLLDNNKFNGTLDMGESISEQLQIVNLKNNNLTQVNFTNKYKKTLILVGNPVCDGSSLSPTPSCSLQQQPSAPYSTSLAHCPSSSCPDGQSVNPQDCICAYPYVGTMYFRSPFIRDVSNSTMFQSLEQYLRTNFSFHPGSVFLQNPFFDDRQYLEVEVKLFPTAGQMYFNRSEIQIIGSDFSHQTRLPPELFGPYYFIPLPYPFPDSQKKSSLNTALIIGIAVGCAVLVIGLVAVAIYALRQRKLAPRAIEFSKPLSSWARTGDESGDIPQLKGARWFSYAEIKKCTNNFSEANEIGTGGYGKVYRGILPGQIIAIKRARQGSAQGGVEFKTEIEMLSRVHHKNLVALVGFCFEQGEQMLVYEYVPNGTLRESLSGRSGVQLDWKMRLRVALGSARGLAYLHELADPPIIHRDVKTSNILLDDKLTAKVSDFGLSKLVSDYEKGHVSTQVKGTLGYMDPEYYMTQQLTEKSDVYSFGVVMLELICARQPLNKGKYIVREVKEAIDWNDEECCGLRELMDPLLRRETSYLMSFRSFAELALRCVQESAADRPTMNDVVKELETILKRDGMRTDSSATEFMSGSVAPAGHPYEDPYPRKDTSGSSFEYSGGYTLPDKPEPK